MKPAITLPKTITKPIMTNTRPGSFRSGPSSSDDESIGDNGENWSGTPGLDGVIVGVCHDINAQLAGADGMLRLLGTAPDLEGEARARLDDALRRIEETVRLLRNLPDQPASALEPLALSDAADTALELALRCDALAELTLEPPPAEMRLAVWARWSALLRLLVELFWAVGTVAPSRTVYVSAVSEGGMAVLRLGTTPGDVAHDEPGAEAGSHAGADVLASIHDAAARLTPLARRAGATILERPRSVLELRLRGVAVPGVET